MDDGKEEAGIPQRGNPSQYIVCIDFDVILLLLLLSSLWDRAPKD